MGKPSETDNHPVAESVLIHVPASKRPPLSVLMNTTEWRSAIVLDDGTVYSLLFDGTAVAVEYRDGSFETWRDGKRWSPE